MLYFLVVFLEWARGGSAQSLIHLANPPRFRSAGDPPKTPGAPSRPGNRSMLSQPRTEEQNGAQRSGETQDPGIMRNSALGMGEGRQGTLPRSRKILELGFRNPQVSTPQSQWGKGIPARETARPEGRILLPSNALIHSLCSKHSDAPERPRLNPCPVIGSLLVRREKRRQCRPQAQEGFDPLSRKWEEGRGAYLGTRTTYSVTFWLPGPCGQRRRDGECGAAEAVAGTPQPHRILTRAAMGDDVPWFGSGPVRSASLSRGDAALAVPGLWPPIEDPRTEAPPILGATPGKLGSLGRLSDHSGRVCACA